MNEGITSTAPKQFIFVLMPFAKDFDDIYKYGIKGAADDAGAYAERVDEQIFTERIFDRVFNQINKADVIVADMTGKNVNVFYEVGYAHALDKTVLLLTQDVQDIPFDLNQFPHIIYDGSIDKLRKELGGKLKWAIEQNRRKLVTSNRDISIYGFYDVLINGIRIHTATEGIDSNPIEITTLPNLQHDIPILFNIEIVNSDMIMAPAINSTKLYIKIKEAGKILYGDNFIESHVMSRLGYEYDLEGPIPPLKKNESKTLKVGLVNIESPSVSRVTIILVVDSGEYVYQFLGKF